MSTSLVSTYFIANFFQTVNYAGALKTQVLENASTEKASTMQTFSQIKKSLVLHKLVWCIFKWGGQVDYRLFFFLR